MRQMVKMIIQKRFLICFCYCLFKQYLYIIPFDWNAKEKKQHLFQHCWSNSYDLCVTSGISGNIPRVHRNHLAAATQTNQTLFFLSFLFFLLIFFLFSFFPPLVLFSPPTRFFLAHCHFRMNTKMYTKRA